LLLLLLLLPAVSLPSSIAARHLLQQDGYVGARMIKPSRSSSTATRSALTSEIAEGTANAAFGGVHRLVTPSNKRTYATVEATEANINTNNRAVAPRARSAQVSRDPEPLSSRVEMRCCTDSRLMWFACLWHALALAT
jgi:hypothetical protein